LKARYYFREFIQSKKKIKKPDNVLGIILDELISLEIHKQSSSTINLIIKSPLDLISIPALVTFASIISSAITAIAAANWRIFFLFTTCKLI
jgi:hypothetical protein